MIDMFTTNITKHKVCVAAVNMCLNGFILFGRVWSQASTKSLRMSLLICIFGRHPIYINEVCSLLFLDLSLANVLLQYNCNDYSVGPQQSVTIWINSLVTNETIELVEPITRAAISFGSNTHLNRE
jgi:hypothetical protein